MKVKIIHNVELQPFEVPEGVCQVHKPGPVSPTITPIPEIELGDLSKKSLDGLITQFGKDVHKRAKEQQTSFGTACDVAAEART